MCQIGQESSISMGILTRLPQPEGMLISMLPRLLAASSRSILLLLQHASLQRAAWEPAKASGSPHKARRCCTRLPAPVVTPATCTLQVTAALRALHLLRPVAAAKGVRGRAGRVPRRPCISPANGLDSDTLLPHGRSYSREGLELGLTRGLLADTPWGCCGWQALARLHSGLCIQAFF